MRLISNVFSLYPFDFGCSCFNEGTFAFGTCSETKSNFIKPVLKMNVTLYIYKKMQARNFKKNFSLGFNMKDDYINVSCFSSSKY